MKKTLVFKVVISIMIIILSITGCNKVEKEIKNDNVKAIVAGELETENISYEENMDNEVAIASITKLMTYLVIKDEMEQGNGSLEDMVSIDSDATLVEGSSFLLQEGEYISVQELMESILIVSANDSCVALAKHFGGTEEEFTNKMNQKAVEIGLSSAKFYSSNGLPKYENGDNIMSGKDVFKMSVHILKKYPEIIDITSRRELVVPERNFTGVNTNQLLWTIQEVDGLKTGFTDEAKYCLVSTAVREDGKRVVVVIMGGETPEARDEISENMIDKMLNNEF